MTCEMQRSVEDFHRAFGSTIGTTPGIRDAYLRARLVVEEARELSEALGYVNDGDYLLHDPSIKPDLAAVLKELCDVLYVAFGSAVAFGVDIQPFFDEVHRSNMTKVGGQKRADGKVLKPPGYEPADIQSVLDKSR